MHTDLRFHLINVSLPKTGSTSLVSIFRRFRAAHEYAMLGTTECLINWQNGISSEMDVDAFLLSRQDVAKLEVDSCTCLHWASHRLPHLFPEARFVLCVRDCASWAISWLAYLHQEVGIFVGKESGGIGDGLERVMQDRQLYFREAGSQPSILRDRWERYCRAVMPGQKLENFTCDNRILELIPDLAPQLVRFWSRSTLNVLQNIPDERLLILRLHALESSVGRLASFVGIDEGSLTAEGGHLNKGQEASKLRDMLDPGAILDGHQDEISQVEDALSLRCSESVS